MNDDMISWVLRSQCVKSFATHDFRKVPLVKKEGKKPDGESTRVVRNWDLLNRVVTSIDSSGSVTGSDRCGLPVVFNREIRYPLWDRSECVYYFVLLTWYWGIVTVSLCLCVTLPESRVFYWKLIVDIPICFMCVLVCFIKPILVNQCTVPGFLHEKIADAPPHPDLP